MRCGWKPERPSSLDRAMEKQPPRDAAINSSGLVPMPCRKRVRNEYCVLFSTPLSVVNVPVPCRRVPFQMTEALRSMMENGRNFPEVPDPFLHTICQKSGQYLVPLTVIAWCYRSAKGRPRLACSEDSHELSISAASGGYPLIKLAWSFVPCATSLQWQRL